jgi:hypothetical protein
MAKAEATYQQAMREKCGDVCFLSFPWSLRFSLIFFSFYFLGLERFWIVCTASYSSWMWNPCNWTIEEFSDRW